MCDTVVRITDDGVLLGKNSDRDVNEAQLLTWEPARDHTVGSSLRCTWREVPQVGHTHAVVLSRPWWMWGAEMGANEHGVVIGNEAVFTRRTGDRGEGALLGMDLLRLALERSVDRHTAVHVLVSLLEEHGQGGSCSKEHPRFTYDSSYLVADPEGALVVETAGRHWATEEVSRVRSISNGLTIAGFAERYADPVRGRVGQCETRRLRTTAGADGAVGPADLLHVLRDHAGEAPVYRAVNGALAAPCAHAGGLVAATQTTASWVADLSHGTPAGGRHWVTGTAAPCTSLFKPVEVGVPAPPDVGVSDRYDAGSAWWRHERLHRQVVRDHRRLLAAYAVERDLLEQQWLADPPRREEAFAEADRRTAVWLDRVAAQSDGEDRRPWWVRRKWRGWNRSAGIPSLVGERGAVG
jgi:secernin